MNDFVIALLVALGGGVYVFRYFSKRATGAELAKDVVPALFAAFFLFVGTLVFLSAVF